MDTISHGQKKNIGMQIQIKRYETQMHSDWDAFTKASRTPTLLHLRNYMDYHKDRFTDASLVFCNEKGQIIALLPACLSNKQENTICSHEGLTYGGFICAPHLHCKDLSSIVRLTIDYYRDKMQIAALRIKPIPYIYSVMPSQDELYILSTYGATLQERHLSQTIRLRHPAAMSQLRKRSINKAKRNNLKVIVSKDENEWCTYHDLLTRVLEQRHHTKPVHTADELLQLHHCFPDQIRLYVAMKDNQLLAGSVVYVSPQVAHTQYLASSDEGRELGALDLVIAHLLHDPYIAQCEYLDFGVSTERDGTLNLGLTSQKEGFGASGVCYDTYLLRLQ